ncbi:beta-ketoacyl-ACP synthase III [Pseudonocardia endophytica]|uniref:Beta-ketoacyl-[acyl-carrier-protein] synthase III n=1 Tax=Pseudonocardia endophytica TaxID=401976 RepID=A0A4R1HWT8_PSEEN|nr:beta-ketoacyl-ACP synthase III [Pseudonocardia endophytica]TCK25240.1 3-oxoacyl-[acyl-carrier-protein] synthase-3 [Pseudonocardia endophytica]
MTGLQLPTTVPGARILGIGSFQPERVVTNQDLEKIVETDDAWIRSRVGIAERRVAGPDESLPWMAVTAGRAAITDAGVDPSDLDAVVVANCTMPNPIPNAAAQVATGVGANGIAAFDLNAACAGFSYGLAVASDMVRAGTARTVLVVGAEKLSDWIDWQDRSTCIIFADAAGAAVVGVADDASVGIGPVSWGSAGDVASTIRILGETTNKLHQEGQAVFRWATSQIAPVALDAIARAGLEPSDIDVLIPHQANLRIVEAIAKKLRAKGAREDMVVADDIVTSGNTSSASIPMALDHMRAAGRVRSGDTLLLVGFGAGLSYAGQVVVCP